MDQKGLEQVLQGMSFGPLRFQDRVGSTNTEALRWADAGAPDLSVVVADEQTAGRGRQGRTWSTPPGAALAFSLVLREGLTTDLGAHEDTRSKDIPRRMARLTALGALAVSQALEAEYNLAAQVKWPNDVLLERQKVCGILTEAQWQGESLTAAVVGIGINVAQASVPPDSEVIYPATCVESVLGRRVDRWQLLRCVLEKILAWRSQLDTPEFLAAWEDKLAFKGEQVYIYTGVAAQASPDEQGILLGLDGAGRLLIRRHSGEVRALNIGELRLRPADLGR
jgi:BirA family transcriptional regulator, biotin operon repressor / biotin---[acetyl-CoA-carboxylase] ligase